MGNAYRQNATIDREIMNDWERQPTETPKAFEAFSVYLDLGANRSLELVSQKLDKSRTFLGRWSSANNWVERAAAYDDYLREQDRIEYEAQRRKAKTDRIKLLSGFKQIVAKSLQNLNVDDPKYSDATQALRLILDQERIEFDDLPTNKHELTGKDGGAIRIIGGVDLDDV